MNNSITLFSKILFIKLLIISVFFETQDSNANWQQVASFGNLYNDVSCMIKKDNYIFAGTHASGVLRSSDNGISWTPVNNGLKVMYIMSFTYNNTGIFCSGAGGVYLSTNNGNNWMEAGEGATESYVVSLTTKNENIYAGHGVAGVYKTTNNGVNWTRFALGEGDKLRAVIYTNDAFYLSIVTAIMRTTNEGATFDHVGNGVYPYNADMFTFYGDDLYTGTEHGLFHTTNDGTVWYPINNGLTDTNITSLTNSASVLFCGTHNGQVFMSLNKGQMWSNVSTGYSDTIVTSLCSDGNYLYAGTESGNIWRRPLSEMITNIKTVSSITPERFELHQNFPNPFNPVTSINFDIKQTSDVRLKIYNSTGKEVIILINERMNSGSYSYNYDASNLPSGIYYYSLEAGKHSITKKMLLVK